MEEVPAAPPLAAPAAAEKKNNRLDNDDDDCLGEILGHARIKHLESPIAEEPDEDIIQEFFSKSEGLGKTFGHGQEVSETNSSSKEAERNQLSFEMSFEVSQDQQPCSGGSLSPKDEQPRSRTFMLIPDSAANVSHVDENNVSEIVASSARPRHFSREQHVSSGRSERLFQPLSVSLPSENQITLSLPPSLSSEEEPDQTQRAFRPYSSHVISSLPCSSFNEPNRRPEKGHQRSFSSHGMHSELLTYPAEPPIIRPKAMRAFKPISTEHPLEGIDHCSGTLKSSSYRPSRQSLCHSTRSLPTSSSMMSHEFINQTAIESSPPLSADERSTRCFHSHAGISRHTNPHSPSMSPPLPKYQHRRPVQYFSSKRHPSDIIPEPLYYSSSSPPRLYSDPSMKAPRSYHDFPSKAMETRHLQCSSRTLSPELLNRSLRPPCQSCSNPKVPTKIIGQCADIYCACSSLEKVIRPSRHYHGIESNDRVVGASNPNAYSVIVIPNSFRETESERSFCGDRSQIKREKIDYDDHVDHSEMKLQHLAHDQDDEYVSSKCCRQHHGTIRKQHSCSNYVPQHFRENTDCSLGCRRFDRLGHVCSSRKHRNESYDESDECASTKCSRMTSCSDKKTSDCSCGCAPKVSVEHKTVAKRKSNVSKYREKIHSRYRDRNTSAYNSSHRSSNQKNSASLETVDVMTDSGIESVGSHPSPHTVSPVSSPPLSWQSQRPQSLSKESLTEKSIPQGQHQHSGVPRKLQHHRPKSSTQTSKTSSLLESYLNEQFSMTSARSKSGQSLQDSASSPDSLVSLPSVPQPDTEQVMASRADNTVTSSDGAIPNQFFPAVSATNVQSTDNGYEHANFNFLDELLADASCASTQEKSHENAIDQHPSQRINGQPSYSDPLTEIEKELSASSTSNTSTINITELEHFLGNDDQSNQVGKSSSKPAHPKQHLCQKCNRMFDSNKDLKVHKRNFHNDSEEKFFCKVCGSGFVDKKTLSKHKATHRQSSDLIQCQICAKTYVSKNSLHTHHKQMHTARAGGFQCLDCLDHFDTKYDLHEHSKCHERVNKSAAKRSLVPGSHVDDDDDDVDDDDDDDVDSHEVTSKARKTDGEKRSLFQCQHCQKTFAFKNSMSKHLQKNRCSVLKRRSLL